jgi:hypothetical protein
MRIIKHVLVRALILLIVLGPVGTSAAEALDGVWIGLQIISYGGSAAEGTTGVVLYQEDDTTLYFYDEYFGSVPLEKSGAKFVLPAPVETSHQGVSITIDAAEFTFSGDTEMSGTISFQAKDTGTGNNIPGSATVNHSKQVCQTLESGDSQVDLFGELDSLQCKKINLPPDAINLDIQTSDGQGDIDLFLIYHRPDFDFYESTQPATQEQINLPSPVSGFWYLLLYGADAFSGVRLSVAYEDTDNDDDGIPNDVDHDDDDDGIPDDWETKYGLNPLVDDADQDPDGDGFSNYEEYKNDTDPGVNDHIRAEIEAFVTRFYQLCLDRKPDQAGLDGWVLGLLNGTLTGSDVAYGFVFSPEFIEKDTSNPEYLTVLYEAFFNRDPDAPGWNGWMADLENGAEREDVLKGFIYAKEFNELCRSFGIMPNPVAAFVTRFYQLCLNRDPDIAGLEGWVASLFSGVNVGADVAEGFIFSAEFADANISNEAYMTILYKAFFNRDPDQAGLRGWLDELDHSTSRSEVLNGFIYSREFGELCEDYGIIPFR